MSNAGFNDAQCEMEKIAAMNALLHIPAGELLDLWEELVTCLHGVNPYGGTVAEIYEYRLQRRCPSRENQSDPGPDLGAVAAMEAVLCLFAEKHSVSIYCNDQMVVTWRGLPTETPLRPTGRRWHLEILEGKVEPG